MRSLDAQLDTLTERVLALASKERFGLADLESLVTTIAHSAYLLTYIESNAKYLRLGSPEMLRSAVLDNTVLMCRLSDQIRTMEKRAGQIPSRWNRAMNWFTSTPEQLRSAVRARSGMDGVREVLGQIDRDRAELLRSVGLPAGSLGTAVERVTDPGTRLKLMHAWRGIGHAHHDKLAAAVDRAVCARWSHAKAMGYRSVAEQGFTSCRASEEQVLSFLVEYTVHAARERREFLSRFKSDGADDELRGLCLTAARRCGPVTFPVRTLMSFITDTVRSVFGLELRIRNQDGGRMEGGDLLEGSALIGTIALDFAVFDSSGPVVEMSQTPAAPNAPQSRILCFVNKEDAVSLDSAHSILHAVGHALVYLMARPVEPSDSGLDFLPLERLEGLSHWFEGLVGTPSFRERFADNDERRAGLTAFLRRQADMSRNCRLEQAIVASVDLDIHTRPGYSVRDAFEDRIAALKGPVGVSFERVVRFMCAPLFRDHPGMGFVYPWGEIFGASNTGSRGDEESPSCALTGYFDRYAQAPPPDVAVAFRSAPQAIRGNSKLIAGKQQ